MWWSVLLRTALCAMVLSVWMKETECCCSRPLALSFSSPVLHAEPGHGAGLAAAKMACASFFCCVLLVETAASKR